MREIRLEFPGGASEDELRSLYNQLNRDRELHGRVDLVRAPTPPDTLSVGAWEAIVIKIAEDISSGLLTAFIVSWIRAAVDWAGRKPQPQSQAQQTITMTLPGDIGVTVDLAEILAAPERERDSKARAVAERAAARVTTVADGAGGPGRTLGSVSGRPAVSLAAPGSRAVLIGTGRYSSHSSGLRNVRAVGTGVSSLSDLLTSRCGMDEENVTPLYDPNDVAEVKQNLRTEALAATEVLLVYFAGHGLIGHEDGELYLSLGHTKREDPEATALPFASVARRLAESPARAIVVILDCCYAGSATSSGSLYRGVTVPRGTAGGYILMASARDEMAMVPKSARYTAFTGEFLEYLRKGDASDGEYLTMGSAGRRLQRVLPEKGFPEPEPGSIGAGDQVILAGNPQAAPRTETMEAPALAPVQTPAPAPAGETEPEMSHGTVPLKRAEAPASASPGGAATVVEPDAIPRDPGYRVPDEGRVPGRPARPAPDARFSGPAVPEPAPRTGDGGSGSEGRGPGVPEKPSGSHRGRWIAVGGGVLALAVILILALALPSGTTSTHNPGPGPAPTGTAVRECAPGTVNLVGSTAFGPIAQDAVTAYEHKCGVKGLKISVDPKDSASGISALVGEVNGGSRDAGSTVAMYDGTYLSPAALRTKPVGAVIFAVIANKALVSGGGLSGGSISLQELEKIFTGGEQGKVAVGRPGGSGSRKALVGNVFQLPPGKQPAATSRTCNALPSSATSCTEDYTQQVLRYVNSLPNGIGYVAYEDYVKSEGTYKNLRVLQIGQTPIGPEQVTDGSYKFWAVEHLYTSASPSRAVQGFLAFLPGYLGKQEQDGFVPCAVLPQGTKNGC